MEAKHYPQILDVGIKMNVNELNFQVNSSVKYSIVKYSMSEMEARLVVFYESPFEGILKSRL
jgi:hypothetical protein